MWILCLGEYNGKVDFREEMEYLSDMTGLISKKFLEAEQGAAEESLSFSS